MSIYYASEIEKNSKRYIYSGKDGSAKRKNRTIIDLARILLHAVENCQSKYEKAINYR